MPDTLLARSSDAVRSLEGNAFLVILDGKTARFLPSSTEADLYALISCAEADATSWEDCQVVWPHCRSIDSSAASINDLPWTTLSVEDAIDLLADRHDWIAIDLQQCKVICGSNAPHLFLSVESRHSLPTISLKLNLAPWWVLQQLAVPNQLVECRTDPPVRVAPHRAELWGAPCLRFFAAEMAKIVREGKDWFQKSPNGVTAGDHQLTVAIHRKWLMTPSPALDGRTPREELHIAKDWIENLSGNQRYRMEKGLLPVSLPQSFSGYETAPLGPHEVILYFEACRTLLVFGWLWILKETERETSPELEERLFEAMEEQLSTWFHTPQEDGLTPATIIQAERDRIPLVAPDHDHADACDCPICDAMAGGMFGPSFVFFDGHHLELEDDFAFSLYSTQEEWEEESCFMGREMLGLDAEDEDLDEDDSFLDDLEREDRFEEDGEQDETSLDEPSPVWSRSTRGNNPIPGDTGKLLLMSFQVAELGAKLQDCSSPHEPIIEVIRGLNTAHREYQNAMQSQLESQDRRIIVANRFKSFLEKIANDYPRLVPHAADLQSQVDEQLRSLRKHT